jgi:hypothetical protein
MQENNFDGWRHVEMPKAMSLDVDKGKTWTKATFRFGN